MKRSARKNPTRYQKAKSLFSKLLPPGISRSEKTALFRYMNEMDVEYDDAGRIFYDLEDVVAWLGEMIAADIVIQGGSPSASDLMSNEALELVSELDLLSDVDSSYPAYFGITLSLALNGSRQSRQKIKTNYRKFSAAIKSLGIRWTI